MELTERQQREREFYAEYARLHAGDDVDFSPIAGSERRPWNPYWFIYQSVQNEYQRLSGSREDLAASEATRPTLLDFGCGTGAAAMLYARLGFHVTGFDICEANVELCARRADRYGYAGRSRFTVMAAEQLELADGQFDVVAGIDILHHVEIEPAIRQVWRVLKPGGLAVFREFVEVPGFDRFRRSRWMTRFFPTNASVDAHRTEDERKLTAADRAIIRRQFPQLQEQRFCLFSRIYRVIRRRHPERACPVERWDARLFQLCPPLRRWGGEIVLLLRKEGTLTDEGVHSTTANA